MLGNKYLNWFFRIFLSLIFIFFGFLKFQDFVIFDDSLKTIYYQSGIENFLNYHGFLVLLGGIEIFIGVLFLLKFKFLIKFTVTILMFYILFLIFPIIFNLGNRDIYFLKQYSNFIEKAIYLLENILSVILGIFVIEKGIPKKKEEDF